LKQGSAAGRFGSQDFAQFKKSFLSLFKPTIKTPYCEDVPTIWWQSPFTWTSGLLRKRCGYPNDSAISVPTPLIPLEKELLSS